MQPCLAVDQLQQLLGNQIKAVRVAEGLGVEKTAFAMYVTVMYLTMTVASPFAGKLLQSMDARVILSGSAILVVAAFLLMSIANTIVLFYVAAVMLGLGEITLLWLAVPTLINRWFADRAGFFIGLCMAFTGIGGVIFNPIGTALINMGPEGWRTGYLVFGIIVLVVTLPFTAFIVRSKPSDKGVQAYGADEVSADAGKPAAPEVGVSADKAMKTAAFFALAGFSFLITVNQTVYQFLPSYCASFSNSVPEIAAVSGVVASACMAGQAIGKVILGAVNDKSCKGGMALGIGSGLVGVVLMWFLPSVVALLFVGAFLFGFVYACTTVQTPLLVRTTFGSRDYTNIYSRVSMAGTLGGVVASTFWAWVIDLPGGFSIIFVLSIVCMALFFLFGFFALGQGKKLEKTEN